MWRIWLMFAAVHGFLSVACGAFAAHGLRDRPGMSAEMLGHFETGARYEMYHALALIAVAWMASKHPSTAINASGWCFTLGTCIFSFSLYILVLTGRKGLGAITPIGGIGMLVGWALLAYTALNAPATTEP